MGMFDSVRCYYREMSEEDQERGYQTKDLNNALDNFEIREDGSLWILEFEEFWRTNQENGKEEYIRENERWIPEESITDTIVFYDYEDGESIDYKVQWTNGKLTYFEKLP